MRRSLCARKWESFFSLLYPSDPKEWSSSLAPTNALKNLIEVDTIIPPASYISATDKAHHHASFGDDYSAPCRWYVRGLANLGVEEEKDALKAGSMKPKLEIETLMIGGLRDAVCPADRARVSMNGSVEGGEKGGRLKVVDVEAGHVSTYFSLRCECELLMWC
jgi:soluble epoxide hydrolase/lipid-phosphate phosphatase